MAPESLRVIAERLRLVTTIQARATVVFEAAGGPRARLDAALAARPPDLLRLRAWKLDRAVFDATLRDGELWLLPPDTGQADERQGDPAYAARGISRAFFLFTPAFYEMAHEDAQRTTHRELVVSGVADTDSIRCVIDRATLTPRRFERLQNSADLALSIDLEDYRVIDSVPWPHTWTISYPEGRVVIYMDEVVLNGALAPSAFVPPRRAVRND